MRKRENHFVPRFYLNKFASSEKRINLYNFNRKSFIKDVSIRTQSRKKDFYGPVQEIEDSIADLEGAVAPILNNIILNKSLPKKPSNDHTKLIAFIALQLLRTSSSANKTNLFAEKMWKSVLSKDSRIKASDLEEANIEFEFPALMALSALEKMLYAFDDLEIYLVSSTGSQSFITSDNPVFRYNQYCEGIGGAGLTGGLNRGLQLFFPISPNMLLLLYDGFIYKLLTRKYFLKRIILNSDIEMLNIMQTISAKENLYFNNWEKRNITKSLVESTDQYRKKEDLKLSEYVEIGNEKRSGMIHVYDEMPNIGLKLSFMKIRYAANKVPLLNRTRKFRKAYPNEYNNIEPDAEYQSTQLFRKIK